MRRRLILAAFIVAAAGVLAGGCGDDDATTTTSSTTEAAGSITIEQWRAQADRICAEGDRGQQQAAERLFGEAAPSQAELEEFGEAVLIPSLQAQHDAIAALPRPQAEAGRIDEMLDFLQDGIDAIAADPSVLVEGTDSVPAIAQTTERAQALGLTECGSG